MKYVFLMLVLSGAVLAADAAPVLANNGGVITITIVVDLTADVLAAKNKIAALPGNARAAALAQSKNELQKFALSRGQQLLAKAEAAVGSTDNQIDAEVTKVTTDIVQRAAALKTARATGEIDPNAP